MPSLTSTTFLSLLVSAASVSAHGFVQGVVVDGTYYTGYLVNQYPYMTTPPDSIGWTETATDLGFVAPDAFASGDIICHRGATNAKASATVKAGGTVVMEWNTWPESHHGPVIDYMASCNGDCTTVDKTSLNFFKIAEAGLIDDTASPGTWASDQLIANNNSWSITVPSTIAAGNYVLRHEIIALHGAGSSNGAQNYPQCINLVVTGGGSDSPTGTAGESLYTETDPGILVNIYTTGLTYTIPGPALYGSGSSGSTATSAAAVVSSTASAIAVTSAKATSAAAVPTTLVTKASSAASVVASRTSAAPVATSAAASADDACDA
ncbi:glycosyl hydrolase family 61-domain-containing protein [Tricladium varicosporioides]|nr:glycosyl hydrolase family 61-domain-containing protein [Hymenoscyphus varicosporioides]